MDLNVDIITYESYLYVVKINFYTIEIKMLFSIVWIILNYNYLQLLTNIRHNLFLYLSLIKRYFINCMLK